jgi:hypothetical protein
MENKFIRFMRIFLEDSMVEEMERKPSSYQTIGYGTTSPLGASLESSIYTDSDPNGTGLRSASDSNYPGRHELIRPVKKQEFFVAQVHNWKLERPSLIPLVWIIVFTLSNGLGAMTSFLFPLLGAISTLLGSICGVEVFLGLLLIGFHSSNFEFTPNNHLSAFIIWFFLCISELCKSIIFVSQIVISILHCTTNCTEALIIRGVAPLIATLGMLTPTLIAARKCWVYFQIKLKRSRQPLISK